MMPRVQPRNSTLAEATIRRRNRRRGRADELHGNAFVRVAHDSSRRFAKGEHFADAGPFRGLQRTPPSAMSTISQSIFLPSAAMK